MSSELDRLLNAGAMLSNCAFNLKQRMPGAQLIESDLESLRSGQEEWDAARRDLASVAEAEPKPIGYVNVYRDEGGGLELGAIDVYPEPEPELAEFADNFVGVGALYLAAHPAPSGMGVKEAAQFLLDRLHEFERELEDDHAYREYRGRVAPAKARLRQALIPAPASPTSLDLDYLRETLSWVRRNFEEQPNIAKAQIDFCLGRIVTAKENCYA